MTKYTKKYYKQHAAILNLEHAQKVRMRLPRLPFHKMAAGEEGPSVADSIVTEFATYEHYLDSQITPTDLYYLEVLL